MQPPPPPPPDSEPRRWEAGEFQRYRPMVPSRSHPRATTESSSGRRETSRSGPSTSHGLKMRGLPSEADEKDVAAFFEGFNLVMVVVVRINGKPTGEGYAYFDSEQEASAALARKNGKSMGDGCIELFVDTENETGLGRNHQQNQYYDGNHHARRGSGGSGRHRRDDYGGYHREQSHQRRWSGGRRDDDYYRERNDKHKYQGYDDYGTDYPPRQRHYSGRDKIERDPVARERNRGDPWLKEAQLDPWTRKPKPKRMGDKGSADRCEGQPPAFKASDFKKFCVAIDEGLTVLETAASGGNEKIWFQGFEQDCFANILNQEHVCDHDVKTSFGTAGGFEDEPELAMFTKFPSFFDCQIPPELCGLYLNFEDIPNQKANPPASFETRAADADFYDPSRDPRVEKLGGRVSFPQYLFLPNFKEQVEEPQEAKDMDVDVSEEEADAKEPKGDAMSTEGIDFETGQWVYWDQGKLVGPNSMFALREMAQNNEIPYGISLERVEDKVWTMLQPDHPEADGRRVLNDFTRWAGEEIAEERKRFCARRNLAEEGKLSPIMKQAYIRNKIHKDVMATISESLLSKAREDLPLEYPKSPSPEPEPVPEPEPEPVDEVRKKQKTIKLSESYPAVKVEEKKKKKKKKKDKNRDSFFFPGEESAGSSLKPEKKSLKPEKKIKKEKKPKGEGKRERIKTKTMDPEERAIKEAEALARGPGLKGKGIGCGRCRWSKTGCFACSQEKLDAYNRRKAEKAKAEAGQ